MDRPSIQPFWLSIFRGAILLIFGLFATIRPVQTIVFLARIAGVYFLIDGIFILIRSLSDRKHGGNWKAGLIRGIIAIVIGAIVIFIPAFTVAAVGVFFMYILGALSLFHGVMELLKAFRKTDGSKGELTVILGGVFFILLALLLFFAPLKFGAVLIRIVGIAAIIISGGLLFSAIRNRPST